MRLFSLFIPVLLCLTSLHAWAQPTQQYCQKMNGNQFLQLRNSAQLNLGNTFTMEAWVYLEASSAYGVVMGKTMNPRSDDPYQHFIIGIDGTGFKPEFVQTTGLSGSYRTATASSALSLNTWTHLAATLESGVMKLYINGQLTASNASPGTPLATTNVPFALGSGASPTNQSECCGFRGAMMQARVWNVARSQTQIFDNRNVQLNGTESGLIAYWPMNENSGQSVLDITSNNYHLTRGNNVAADGEDPTAVLVADLGPYFSYSTFNLPAESSNAEDFCLIDYNADGKKDIFATRLKSPPTNPATFVKIALMKNNGNMNFVNENAITGNDALVHPRDFTVADFNNDGKEDLFVGDHGTDVNPFPGGQNRLYLQNANGQLAETSSGKIPTLLDFTHNSAAADIDNDNDKDLYVCNIYNSTQAGPYILVNNGSATFTVKAGAIPTNIANLTDKYMSSRFADMDNDGDQDLVLGAADNTGIPRDALLLNNGSGTFSISANALPIRNANNQWGTVGIAVADVNKDGYQDLLMATLYQYQTCKIQLLVNNKNGTFSDSSQNIPQNWPTSNTWIKWIETADFNNDGWIDFLVSTHVGTPKLYLNTGATKFIDATPALSMPYNGVVSFRAADLDQDGLTDIAFLDYTGRVILAKNLRPYTVQINNGTTTSVRDLVSDQQTNFEVYPNPISDRMMIRFSKPVGTYQLRLLNMNGQLIWEKIYDATSAQMISTENLSGGVYMLHVIKDHKLVGSQKIVK
jgi:hypothetical protein